MTVINNIIELIGTNIKSIDDLVEGGRRPEYLKKLSVIEKQLLDEETKEFMERLRIPPELGYLLAYQHHIKRMSQLNIEKFIYEKTGQKVGISDLLKLFCIPTRNISESSPLQYNPNINFQLLEQRLPLSCRELEILETRIQEGTNSATGRQLSISEQTVKNHLSNVYEKLGVKNFTEAVIEAHKRGIINFPNMPNSDVSDYKRFESIGEHQEHLARQRGFKSEAEYLMYLRLKRHYEENLLNLAMDLRTGYDIEFLELEEDGLVVKVLEERGLAFDDDFTANVFRETLQRCLQHVGVDGNFGVSCKKSWITITPDSLEARAFLDAYKLVLKREIVK